MWKIPHFFMIFFNPPLRAVVRTITCTNTDGSQTPLLELDHDTPCQLDLGVSGAQCVTSSLHSVIILLLGLCSSLSLN